MQRQTQASYPYFGLGFQVNLLRCPVIQFDGEWVPDIDFNRLARDMALVVPLKPAPLTGNEIKFLRRQHGLTLEDLAKRLQLCRQAVMKWEKRGDDPASLEGPSDIAVRLLFLDLAGVKDSKLFKEASQRIWNLSRTKQYTFNRRADRRHTQKDLILTMIKAAA